jgi:tRNA A-37 threonylcarbamoyl transferase component Bud32
MTSDPLISAAKTPKTTRDRLDEDCLYEGDVHPSVAERLARVRELPVIHVASLLAIERDANGVWAVWSYVPGRTLEEIIAAAPDEKLLSRLIDQLRQIAAAMHGHGIVHGAIHPRNVIVDDHGQVHLTHVSPLLFDDPREDEQAIDAIAVQIGLPPEVTPMNRVVRDKTHRLLSRIYALLVLLAGIAIFFCIRRYVR